MAEPFSLTGLNPPVVNMGAGTVVLSWIPLAPATQSPGIVTPPGLGPVSGTYAVLQTVNIQRALFGSEDWTTIATSSGVDFAGSTYTDTPAAGSYFYRLQVIAANSNVYTSQQIERVGLTEGVPPAPFPQPGKTTPPTAGTVIETRNSNQVSASTLNSVTLTVTANGPTVTLNWTVGAGEIMEATVWRTGGPAGVARPVKNINGRQAVTYQENIGTVSTLSYYVVVLLQEGNAGITTTLQSNTVTLTVQGSAQDVFGHS